MGRAVRPLRLWLATRSGKRTPQPPSCEMVIHRKALSFLVAGENLQQKETASVGAHSLLIDASLLDLDPASRGVFF